VIALKGTSDLRSNPEIISKTILINVTADMIGIYCWAPFINNASWVKVSLPLNNGKLCNILRFKRNSMCNNKNLPRGTFKSDEYI